MLGKETIDLYNTSENRGTKIDIKQHPRYKYLDEADKNNRFDITEYMKTKSAVPKPEQEFVYYEYSEH